MFYFSWGFFFREIYKNRFFEEVKHINLQKAENLPLQPLLFACHISQDLMCCENFGRFHRRKLKIITNKAINT